MKKLMVFLILLSASLQGFGRITDDEKGFTAGVGLSLGQLYRNHDTYVMIQPKVGCHDIDRQNIYVSVP